MVREGDPSSSCAILLGPISKSPEEDNEAGELNEAKEFLWMIFPSDEVRRCHWIQAKKRSTNQRRKKRRRRRRSCGPRLLPDVPSSPAVA